MSEADDIIISNLVEKDSMKVSLSHSDPGAIQHNFIRSDEVKVRVSKILTRYYGIADSFILNHPVNSKMYISTQVIQFDNDLGALVFDEFDISMLDGTMGFWRRD